VKLGLQGVTIIFASGDSGAGPGCIGLNGGVFNVEYLDCPYITTVGATSLLVGGFPGDPELSQFPNVPMWESSGGFSNIFARPSYQEEAVNSSVHIAASS
jgi:tripeptidyl-peptidase-1